MARSLEHALLADQAEPPWAALGCVFWIGILGLGFGAYLHFFEPASKITEPVFIVSGIVAGVGLIGMVLLSPKKTQDGLPMLAFGSDGTRLLCGTAGLTWHMDETARLPSGHYLIDELEGRTLQELDPKETTLLLVIEGGEKSKQFQVQGFAVTRGDEVLLEAVGRGAMAVEGDDAYAAMTPALGARSVNAVEGLARLERAIGSFPDGLTVSVLVVSPTMGHSVTRTLVMGGVGRALDAWTDAAAKKKVEKLVESGAVRDPATGTGLVDFCRERGWQLIVD